MANRLYVPSIFRANYYQIRNSLEVHQPPVTGCDAFRNSPLPTVTQPSTLNIARGCLLDMASNWAFGHTYAARVCMSVCGAHLSVESHFHRVSRLKLGPTEGSNRAGNNTGLAFATLPIKWNPRLQGCISKHRYQANARAKLRGYQ